MKNQEKYFELCNRKLKTMIRQDYIIRMIQEIFAAIANLILRRKHISKSDWEEYESTARQVLEVTPQQLEEMDGQTILENTVRKRWDGEDRISRHDAAKNGGRHRKPRA